MKKHSVQILISLIIISLLITPVFVYGYTETGEGEATLLQEGNYDIESGAAADYYTPLRALTVSAETSTYNQLMAVSAQIDLRSYNIPVDDIDAFYSNVINDNPDLFFVSSSYQYNYYPSTNCVAYIFPAYAMTSGEIAAAQEIFNAGKEKALAQVDSSMDDLQKALVLHDYICSEGIYPVLEYNSNNELTNDEDIWHSAYGFFYNKVAVCAGFTLTYSYLLKQLGIDCEYVGSNDMGHAWNKVKIDGSWYNADLTFDNFDTASGVNTYGSVRHVHFLKSDDYFASESGSYHTGGVTYDSCDAVSTTYDSAFWDTVTSRFYVLNGNYYYLKPASNYYSVTLTKRTQAGAETTVGSAFSTASLGYTSSGASFTDSLARLAYLDNRFYVVASRNIYSVLFSGTRYTITSVTNYCNGLGVNDDNNLFWQPYNDSTSVNVLDKLEYYNTYLTTTKGSNYNNYPDINLDGVINAKDYALIIK